MGLLQKALETYEAMEKIVGIYEEGKEEPLAPIGHIVTRAQIEVTINADGEFKGAKLADKDKKIIIPVTEESSGRTSSPAAHPLCEQLGYLLGDDEGKFDLYINNLTQWCQSAYAHPKAKAVLAYIQQRTLRSDLINAGQRKGHGLLACAWLWHFRPFRCVGGCRPDESLFLLLSVAKTRRDQSLYADG